jgi:hypothetical protein
MLITLPEDQIWLYQNFQKHIIGARICSVFQENQKGKIKNDWIHFNVCTVDTFVNNEP